MKSQQDATWVGAVVVTHEGKRISWKIVRGVLPQLIAINLNMSYYGGRDLAECIIRQTRFLGHNIQDSFEKARDWAREFERHPEATGQEP